MSASFVDYEDDSNPLNGTVVRTPEEIALIVARFAKRPPSFFNLIGVDYELLVGVAGTVGCAQLSRKYGDAPYLVALANEQSDGAFTEYLAGGTATPILDRYNLPIEMVILIAKEFIETGQRSTLVVWEEI